MQAARTYNYMFAISFPAIVQMCQAVQFMPQLSTAFFFFFSTKTTNFFVSSFLLILLLYGTWVSLFNGYKDFYRLLSGKTTVTKVYGAVGGVRDGASSIDRLLSRVFDEGKGNGANSI